MAPPAAKQPAATRVTGVDALRGIAVVAMVAYHFCFDLANFEVVRWNFYRDPFWTTARTLILSSSYAACWIWRTLSCAAKRIALSSAPVVATPWPTIS